MRNGKHLVAILVRHRRELVGMIASGLEDSNLTTPGYKSFLASSKGRRRLRKYIDLVTDALRGSLEPFWDDQKVMGKARAAQGIGLEEVHEVAEHARMAIWDVVLRRYDDRGSIPTGVMKELRFLEWLLDRSRAILARSYIEARENEIIKQSSYLQEAYRMTLSAFSSIEVAPLLKRITQTVRDTFHAVDCGVILTKGATELSAGGNARFKPLSHRVQVRLLKAPLSEAGYGRARVISAQAGARKAESWLLVPVRAYGETLGLLYVVNPSTKMGMDEENLLRAFASALAGAVASVRLYSELTEKQNVLSALARNVIQVQEDERKVLAAELHDGATQALVAALYHLEACNNLLMQSKSGEASGELQRARHLVTGSLEEMRTMVQNLRPPVIDDLGLPAGIRALAKSLFDGTETKVRFTAFCQEDLRLPPHVELTLYRVTQEALNNVKRHAVARNVGIELRVEPGQVRLSIHDDGVGFDAGESPGRLAHSNRFGMIGMSERIRRLGGEFNIASRVGAGTSISVAVPLIDSKPG